MERFGKEAGPGKRIEYFFRNFVFPPLTVIIKYGAAFACIFLILILILCKNAMVNGLKHENRAESFANDGGYAQISVYFSENSGFGHGNTAYMEQVLTEKLQEASIDVDESDGREFLYAYSSDIGKLKLVSDRTEVEVSATAVGGDFFMLHPYELLDGQYFGEDDLNGDGLILDEDTAWQLFGSSNVSGMYVTIGDCVYPVRGVIKRDSGLFAKASGETDSMIFVSYSLAEGNTISSAGNYSDTSSAYDTSSYSQSDTSYDIDCMELIMVNPVKEFAYSTLESFIKESLSISEDKYELVENSKRYSLTSTFKVISKLGQRSMHTSDIIYPSWENRARAYEDVCGLFLVLELVLAVYPLIIFVITCVACFKRLRAGSLQLKNRLKDFADRKCDAFRARHITDEEAERIMKSALTEASGVNSEDKADTEDEADKENAADAEVNDDENTTL